jgi:hypothetical protein
VILVLIKLLNLQNKQNEWVNNGEGNLNQSLKAYLKKYDIENAPKLTGKTLENAKPRIKIVPEEEIVIGSQKKLEVGIE